MKYFQSLWKKITHREKRSRTVRYMFPLVLGALAILGASVISTQKSYIKLVPSQTSVLNGERFSIQIYASAHVPVNAIDIKIDFSPSTVEIISVDKGQSVLTIWTEEPKVSGNTISLSGGTFRKGFVGEHLIATIKVQAMAAGKTEFFIKNANLLAGDGKGTPVIVSTSETSSKASFYIYDQSEDPSTIEANIGIIINADIDGDGKVTLKDISSFMAAWNSQSKTYDFNNDGRMNFIDFSIILAKSFFN